MPLPSQLFFAANLGRSADLLDGVLYLTASRMSYSMTEMSSLRKRVGGLCYCHSSGGQVWSTEYDCKDGFVERRQYSAACMGVSELRRLIARHFLTIGDFP